MHELRGVVLVFLLTGAAFIIHPALTPFNEASADFPPQDEFTKFEYSAPGLLSHAQPTQNPNAIIVQGEVLRIVSRHEGNQIFTRATIVVREVARGPPALLGKEITVRHLGGAVDGTILWVSNQPNFAVGQIVRVELRDDGEFYTPTSADTHASGSGTSFPTAAGYVLLWYHPTSGWAVTTTRPGSDWYGPIKWSSGSFNYWIDSRNLPSGVTSSAFINAVTASFQTWEDDPGSSFDFIYQGTRTDRTLDSNDGVNLMGWGAIGGGTIAYTTIWAQYTPGVYDSLYYTDSDIRFDNTKSWSAEASGVSGKFDVQNIGTHEAGHTFGLGDMYEAADSEHTMYGYGSTGETKKRTLEWGDRAGIAALYPGSSSFDFSLANSGGITAPQGGAGTNTITASLVSGTPSSVTLSCTSGLPAGATCSFSPAAGAPTFSATLTVATSPSTPIGSTTLEVTGTSGGTSRTTSFTLTVNPGAVGNPASTAIYLIASPNPVRANNQFAVTATLGGAWHELAGVVSGKAITITGWGTSRTCATGANGACQVTLTAPLVAGLYSIFATFDGDANFNPSSGQMVLTVNPPGIRIATIITVRSYEGIYRLKVTTLSNSLVCLVSQSIAVGQTATIECIVQPGTYKVLVYRYSSVIRGPITVTVPPDYVITISYAMNSATGSGGESLRTAAIAAFDDAFVVIPLTDGPASIALTISASPNPVRAGSQTTFTVTMRGTWHELAGFVSNKLVAISGLDATVSCTTNAAGTCQVTVTAPTTIGSYPVTAQFTGDANFNPGSGFLTLGVDPPGIRISAMITVRSYAGIYRLKVTTLSNALVCLKSQDIAVGQTATLECIVQPGTYKVLVYRYSTVIRGPTTASVPPDYLITILYAAHAQSTIGFGMIQVQTEAAALGWSGKIEFVFA